MTDRQPKKAKAKLPPKASKALKKDVAKQVETIAKMANVEPNYVFKFIQRKESIRERKRLLGAEDRELNAEAKGNGISMKALNSLITWRSWDPQALLNWIEDSRQYVQACPDMAQLDIFGIKAIQKYVDEHKLEAAPAASPEAGAKSLMGHNSKAAGGIAAANDAEPVEQGIAPPAPRRVSEIVTH